MDDKLITNNIYFLASAFSRKLTNQADEIFAAMGLSSSHALLLYIIHQNPEIQPSQLAEILHLSPSTITRLVQKLEQRQWVEKQSVGRASIIVCTSSGIRLAKEASQKWEQLIQQKRKELGERYVEVLSEMISKALENIASEST